MWPCACSGVMGGPRQLLSGIFSSDGQKREKIISEHLTFCKIICWDKSSTWNEKAHDQGDSCFWEELTKYILGCSFWKSRSWDLRIWGKRRGYFGPQGYVTIYGGASAFHPGGPGTAAKPWGSIVCITNSILERPEFQGSQLSFGGPGPGFLC